MVEIVKYLKDKWKDKLWFIKIEKKKGFKTQNVDTILILGNLDNIYINIFKRNYFIRNKTNINEIVNNADDLIIFVKIRYQ